MYKEYFYFTKSYVNKKYENYSLEILSENPNEFGLSKTLLNNLDFNTVFDALVFIILYENDKYKFGIKRVTELVRRKIGILEEYEINLLFSKCWEDYKFHLPNRNVNKISLEIKSYYITKEFINIINQKVFTHLSEISGVTFNKFLKEVQEELEKKSYVNQIDMNHLKGINVLEEYCMQVQSGNELLASFIERDIKQHIFQTLTRIEIKDIILLYTQTEYFILGETDNINPIPTKEEMIYCIVPKLLEEIKNISSNSKVISLLAD